MFPATGLEADRSTLPRIAHDGDYARGDHHARDGGARSSRAPPQNLEAMHEERRPATATERHHTPPSGSLGRPSREMEAPRLPPFGRAADDAYAAPGSSRFAQPGASNLAYHRDQGRVSPASDEGNWHSFDRSDPRFGPKDQYSPHTGPAPYPPREDVRPSPWQRPLEELNRPRMPGPPVGVRDEAAWRPGPPPYDRTGAHPEALAHARIQEDERWGGGDFGGRPMHPYEASGGPAHPAAYPADPRGGPRPLDGEFLDDSRRVRRRGPPGLVDADQDAHRYPPVHARPYGPGPYSPPDSRSQSVAPGPGGMRPMPGMEAPRPASSLGVMNRGGMHSVAGPVSGVAASGPANASTVNANRRVAHLLSEQKRRESINTGFEDLRQAIPACRDGQDSKATILKRALEYIRELESVVERQHRAPLDGHAVGGYSNRSPPDDKDHLRRFGRPGADDERHASTSGRHLAGASSGSNSETGSGPRIGGLPSNAFSGAANNYAPGTGPYSTQAYTQRDSPNMAAAPMRAGAAHDPSEARGSASKRWAEAEEDDQRSPSRRRVSDGDKDEPEHSPIASHYTIAPHARRRSPLAHSPSLEKPRDWHPRLENKSLVDSAVRV